MNFMQPSIPVTFMTEMEELRAAAAEYRPDMGGQSLPGEVTRVPFRGAVLPLSEDDLRRAPQGTYTAMSYKLYTNGHKLGVGSRVKDVLTGYEYTVTGELDHGNLATVLRYVIERKGTASQ